MNEEKYGRGNTRPCGSCAPEGVFRTSWRSREDFCPCPGGRETEPEGSCDACRIPARETCRQSRPEPACGCKSRPEPTCGGKSCPEGIRDGALLQDRSLAMVYAASQKFEGVYEPGKALCRGTSFCGLDKPFYGDRRD